MGSAYGLVKITENTILNVVSRNSSDDGIETKEQITLKNEIGQKTFPFNIWDTDYIILD